MTEQNKTPLTAQPGSVPPPECKPSEKPLRRVGSLTLGAGLIAAVFLCNAAERQTKTAPKS